MELTHGGKGAEEAGVGVGVVLAFEDPGDDVLGAGEQRLLVLSRRGGGRFVAGGGGGRCRCQFVGVHLRHWNRAGPGVAADRLGLGFGVRVGGGGGESN